MEGGVVKTVFGSCAWSFEEGYVHIYNLFVSPEFRLQGRAKSILQQAITVLRESGYTGEISIVADSENVPTEKLAMFYTRLGLKVYNYYG